MAKRGKKRSSDEIECNGDVDVKKIKNDADKGSSKTKKLHDDLKKIISNENPDDISEKTIGKLLKKLKNDDIIQDKSEKKELKKKLKKLKKELKKNENNVPDDDHSDKKSSKKKKKISDLSDTSFTDILDTSINEKKSMKKLEKEKKRIEKLLECEKSPSKKTDTEKRVEKEKADNETKINKNNASTETSKKKHKKKDKQDKIKLKEKDVEKSSKKSKSKKNKTDRHDDNVPDEENSKSAIKEKKHKHDKVVSTKRKKTYKEKREKHKEQRKLVRQEEGQFNSINKMSLDEMKKKIAELNSQGNLSKTALRRLRVLKKKVSVEESLNDKAESTKRKSDILEDATTDENKNKKFKKDSNKKIEIDIDDELPKVQEKCKIETNKLLVEDENNKNVEKSKKNKKAPDENLNEMFIEDRVGDACSSTNHIDDNISKDEPCKLNIGNKIKGKIKDAVEKNFDQENDKQKVANISDINSNAKSNQSRSEGEISSSDENDEKVTSNSKDVDQEDNDLQIVAEITKNTQIPNKEKKIENHQSFQKKRYVLFVGNVAYETTTVDLKKHFLKKVSKVKDVRIPLKPDSKDPRGFAYVEVENNVDYEKALSLHGTFVKGRKINVQYTLGGPKNNDRRSEAVHKNKKLHAMRRAGMLQGSKRQRPRFPNSNFKNQS